MSQYAEIINKYELHENVNDEILHKNGFNRNGIFRCYVYKNIIQFIANIDIEEHWWDYQICDVDTQLMHTPLIYPAYYNRSGGKHLEIDEIDKKVDKIIQEFVNQKILQKVKD